MRIPANLPEHLRRRIPTPLTVLMGPIRSFLMIVLVQLHLLVCMSGNMMATIIFLTIKLFNSWSPVRSHKVRTTNSGLQGISNWTLRVNIVKCRRYYWRTSHTMPGYNTSNCTSTPRCWLGRPVINSKETKCIGHSSIAVNNSERKYVDDPHSDSILKLCIY